MCGSDELLTPLLVKLHRSMVSGRSSEAMEDNQTTKQCSTTGCQPYFARGIIIRGDDPRHVADIKLPCLSIGFLKKVLIGLQVIGSARVHRWTSHKPAEPVVFFYKDKNLRKINF